MMALTAIALGVLTLVGPVFTPPNPFYPTLFGFAPYCVLGVGVLTARSRREHWSIAVISVATMVSAYFYLDCIYFDRVFSWQIAGRVQDVLPVAQLAVGLPLLGVLAMRRWKSGWEAHETWKRRSKRKPR